ncbi:HotDog domain-containing protein [Xylariaceae sp. FL0662B]|nr:HotDog domain-containing protein [Xylariaceae sp. FL0662B]
MTTASTESSDYAHFEAISWCARHLHGSRIVTKWPPSRIPKPNSEDTLYAETLKSQSTISAILMVYDEPTSPTACVDSAKMFLTLGSALNGHPGVCHGGIIATILDEAVGLLVPVNVERGTIPNVPYMTAYLNTTYLWPVQTPATILVRSKSVRVEGRKYFVEGSIEDAKGTILAKADALYVGLKSNL